VEPILLYRIIFPHGVSRHDHPKYRKTFEVNDIVETVDIAPTILDVLGLENPTIMQGESLFKVISDGSDNVAFTQTFMSARSNPENFKMAIRTNKFKYVYRNLDPDLFFNLTVDPFENEDIFNSIGDNNQFETMIQEYIDGCEDIRISDSNMELDEMSKEKLMSLGYLV
jgi:arylsulfatase A-like enzyme